MLVFEDETIVTQKPYIRKSMSFQGQQQKIKHNGSRKRFSMYISMLWSEQNFCMISMTDQILPVLLTILKISRCM
jgi:hypothetical protein